MSAMRPSHSLAFCARLWPSTLLSGGSAWRKSRTGLASNFCERSAPRSSPLDTPAIPKRMEGLFRLAFGLPDYLRVLYKCFGNSLDRSTTSQNTDCRSARYVIDKEGIIRAADANADQKIRPEP